MDECSCEHLQLFRMNKENGWETINFRLAQVSGDQEYNPLLSEMMTLTSVLSLIVPNFAPLLWVGTLEKLTSWTSQDRAVMLNTL